MARISHDDNFIYLHGVIPSDNSMMEIHHNAVYSKPKRHWRLPLNLHVLNELYRTFKEFRDDREFIDLGFRLKNEQDARIAMWKEIAKVGGDPDGRLRVYQYEDMLYMSSLESGLIANEPRTGKTPMSIRLMRAIGGKRNLVVAPASLVLNWESEIRSWWPEANVFVYSGPKRDTHPYFRSVTYDDRHSVLIVSKDTLKLDAFKDKGFFDNHVFDTAFVDEAHFLRNYDTAQAKAVFTVNAKRKYAMTGTPTVNHPSDIWGILHFLYPKKYPSYWQFCGRYFQVYESQHRKGQEVGWPKPSREREMKELVGMISVQRKRSEVMPWLPKKQYKKLTCRMEGKQLKLYKEMKDFFTATDDFHVSDAAVMSMIQRIDEGHQVDAQNVIVQLIRLRQLCLDPRLVGFDVKGAKTELLLDYLENRREPIVVMSMFTSYLKMLGPMIQKLGLKVGYVHGQMSNAEKQANVNAFQSGKLDILLCNIISAGVGITLDAGNTVLFLDRAWTPAENEQAEDRVCPTTEERNHAHIVIDLECEGSVDGKINKILSKKRSLVQVINEGGREAIRQLLVG